jgi:N-acetylmuramoyl-L-alanine amidase
MTFAPTAGDRDQTIFLDAGHGGIDPGAVGVTGSGQTIYEADLTLPVELDTMALLRAQGFRVVVSRTRASSVVRLRPADSKEPTTTWRPEICAPTWPTPTS